MTSRCHRKRYHTTSERILAGSKLGEEKLLKISHLNAVKDIFFENPRLKAIESIS